jgi:hypothetical protein
VSLDIVRAARWTACRTASSAGRGGRPEGSAQLRAGSGDDPLGETNRRLRRRRGPARRAARQRLPDPFADRGDRHRSRAHDERPQPTRWSPTGRAAARRRHRRLRAGAARRRRGRRGRRRHAGWRGAVAGVTDQAIARCSRSAPGSTASPPRSARASPAPPMRSTTPSPSLLPTIPAMSASFVEGPRGKPHFDLEAYVVARLAAAGVGGSRRSGSTPMRSRTASTATAAPPTAPNRLMDGS